MGSDYSAVSVDLAAAVLAKHGLGGSVRLVVSIAAIVTAAQLIRTSATAAVSGVTCGNRSHKCSVSSYIRQCLRPRVHVLATNLCSRLCQSPFCAVCRAPHDASMP